jgi:hypothetical protein
MLRNGSFDSVIRSRILFPSRNIVGHCDVIETKIVRQFVGSLPVDGRKSGWTSRT